MPHTLRAVDRNSEVLSALKVLSGFDEDLACESTRAINRLRSLLVQIYPSLERVLPGVVLTRAIVLDLLIRYHGPAGLKSAGRTGAEAAGLVIPRITAQILLTAGDMSASPTPGHLAAYAGIAPVTRRSGSSVRGEFPSRTGNKRLKNALFRSAWAASCHDPLSKAHYDRKRVEGKRHNAAFTCLARRRLNVMYAMMKHRTLYEPRIPLAA